MSRKRPLPAAGESEPDWHKSLTVDSLVEALDVQNLWYPARVIQMEGSKVLLHFLGWGAQLTRAPRGLRGVWTGYAHQPPAYVPEAQGGLPPGPHALYVRGRLVRVLWHARWGDEWDEWIERDSAQLRRHRGWGTPAMPTDWQQDSIIEALDMEGKWYAAPPHPTPGP